MFKKDKKKKAARLDTLVGHNTRITGDILFNGGLRIDGHVEGNIVAPDDSDAVFTLSEQGQIEGEVRAPNLLINGAISGNVYSSQYIELAPKARINGNVYYHLLEMAIGAEVNGQLIHINKDNDDDILDLPHDDAASHAQINGPSE